MRTEYTSIRFCYPARILPGKPRAEIEARGGLKLVRETGGDRDDLIVYGPGLEVPVEVPWSNIASATRLSEPTDKPAERPRK